MKSEELFFLLKMSIFQFLLKNKISFCNKGEKIIFSLFTNDKTIEFYNSIILYPNNNIYLESSILIKQEFLNKDKLKTFSNYINEFYSGIFSCFIQEQRNKSELFIRNLLKLRNGIYIDDDFWKKQLIIQINNFSTITNFLFNEFPKSKFFKNKEIESKNFKDFLFNQIQKYINALEVIEKENNKKEDFEDWTEKQLNKEINKELDNYFNNKNEERLNLLVQALKNKNKI